MNRCSIFGHKIWVKPKQPLNRKNVAPYIVSCNRCGKICGVWIYFFDRWAYFKR